FIILCCFLILFFFLILRLLLSSTLFPYTTLFRSFFLLCKRKWLNQLKKTGNKEVTINEEVLSKDDDAQELAFETSLFEQQHSLYQDMFEKLGQACKDLLKATFKIKSMEEVAESLGVTYAYARKKKSLCIGQLTKWIQESPTYKNLKS